MAKSTSAEPGNKDLRESLRADVEAFLASGKKITQIPTGVSGVDASKGNKNITIGQSKKR